MCVFFCVAICMNIIMGIFLCNVCVFGWESCSVNGYPVKCVMWAVARVDTLAQHTALTEKGMSGSNYCGQNGASWKVTFCFVKHAVLLTFQLIRMYILSLIQGYISL